MKSILFIFPNTANKPLVSTAIPILAGIAKIKNWNINYFDTAEYKKNDDSVQDKEKTGCFPPRPEEMVQKTKDFSYITNDLQSIIDDKKPDIIAITAMTCDYEFLMKFWPNINVYNAKRIIGGFHSTVLPDEVLSSNLFDIVCIGQGEKTFEEILDDVPLENIKGIAFKKDDSIIKTEKRLLLTAEEIWAIDRNYEIYNSTYFDFPFDGKAVKSSHIEASRGCPYKCSYCGNDVLRRHYQGLGKYLTVRPFDSLFKQVEMLIRDFNIEIFSFIDECFMKSPAWLEEFCDRWKKIAKPFLIQTRPEFVTSKSIETLLSTNAPFVQIGMGVESGSKRILTEICDRHIKKEDTIAAYDLISSYSKIRGNAYFMMGFPTETREEVFETIELCRRIKSKINGVAIYQPFPGQRMRDICIDKGYIKGDEPMNSFTGGSILNQPHITNKQIYDLWRCFMLYAKLPKEYLNDITKCEFDFENNKELFQQLVDLRWKLEK